MGEVPLIKITDSAEQINRKILEAAKAYLNPALSNSVADIKESVSNIVVERVRKSPEVQSLLKGQLRLDFGFVSSPVFVNSLLDAIKSSIIVEFKPLKVTRNEFSGGIKISMIRDDYSEILGLTKSSYESAGGTVNWLYWLLFEGTNIIIADFSVKYAQGQQFRKGEFRRSRSGGAIMIESNRGYQVPPQFAGTREYNFITRSISDTEPLINAAIQNIVRARI